MTSIPAFSIGGITRPELFLDPTGNILLDPAAQSFANQYGLKALYLGCPPGTPYPPVPITNLLLTTPVDTDSGTNTVLEGAAANTPVHLTAEAHDIIGLPITYSLTNSASGAFQINSTTGVVTVADPNKVDFESAPGHAYNITVQASDGLFTTSQNFTIAVTDQPPVISSPATASINEGVAAHSAVYTAVAADPGGGTVTYSLSGTDAAAFTIDSATGIVTINGVPDFETKSSYSFTIKASDSSGLFNTEAVTLSVNDLAPVISSPATASVNEAVAAHTIVYTAVAADPGGGTVTYSLTGADAAAFTIDPATGVVTINGVPDFETQSAYHFNVKASDASGAFNTEAVTVSVNDLPPVVSSGAAASVNEGVAAHTAVYTAVAADPAGGTVTYSLTGTDAAAFTIDPATGIVTINGVPDFETQSSYSFNVKASDPSGAFNTEAVTLSVTDLPPVISSPTTASVNEGVAAHSTVYTAVAADPGGGAVTYALSGADAAAFTIDSATGIVTINGVPDFETQSSYNFTIKASDSSGLFNTEAVTLNVNDLAPVISSPATASVNEAVAAHTIVYTAVAADPGGGTVTYALTGTDAAAFTIDPATGVVTINGVPDFETQSAYHFNVKASDASGAFNTEAVTVSVNDLPPVISSGAAASVNEGVAAHTAVYTAVAADPAGGAVTYSLTGTDAAAFTIDPATGIVTINGVPDFETQSAYHFNVKASDASGAFNTEAVTISVNDLPPVISSPAVALVNEGVAAHTAVYTAVAADPGGGAVTYALSGADAAAFTIDSATGIVTINGVPDFETQSSYSFNVKASDASGAFNTEAVTLNVNDLPPVISSPATASVNEGVAAHTTVYTAVAADPGGGTVIYSLTGADAAAFTIDPATGIVTINGVPDFETQSAYHFNVKASDASGVFNTEAVTLDINDLPPIAPIVDTNGGANQVGSGAPAGASTGITAFAADPGGGTVTYSLTDDGGGRFTIDPNTGVVTASGTVPIVFDPVTPANNSITITVSAHDPSAEAITQNFTISVVLDAAPVVTAGHTLSYTENQAATAIDPAVTVTDSDNANLAHATVHITGNYVIGEDVLGFINQNGITGSFDAATGTETLTGSASVANYQAALESVTYFNTSDNPSGLARTVTIIANDGTVDSTPATDTINVTPVNDPPVVTAGHTLNYTENQAATAFDPAITVSDVDSANLASATVQISGNYVNGQDVLAFTPQNGITGTFNAGTGTLTLSGSDTVAHYQAALASVTYVNTSENPSGLDRTVTIIANDGTANSAPVTDTIHVTPVDDAPVTTAGGSLNYTENQAATAIDPSVTVSDVDSANMSGATVQITGNYVNGQDVLGFIAQNGITGSFNAGTGTLTLSGSSSQANYQAALDSVTYFNSSDDPSGLDRTISFTVNDGTLNSNTSTSTVHVTPVDDAPVNVKPGAQTTLEDTSLTFSTGTGNAISVSDVDAESGNLQVDLGVSHGLLTLSGTAGLTVTGNGTAAVELTGTLANIDAALNGLVYAPAANFNGAAADTLTITTNDLGNTGIGGPLSDADTVTINITPVNDAPSFTVGPNQLVNEDSGAHTVANFATGLSAGPPDESGQTLNFIVSNNNAAMFSVAPSISPTGTLTYTTAANYSGTATVTVQIHDNGGTANGGVDTSAAQTFVIDASPIADTPTFTTALTPVAATAESQVDTVSTGIQNTAAVAALASGGYVVVWQDTNEDNTEAQFYNASGAKVGGNFAVTPGDLDGGGVNDTAVDILSINGFMAGANLGGFLVIDGAASAVTGGEFIEGHIVSSAGTVTSTFQISPDIASTGDLGFGPATSAVFSDGSFIAVWELVKSDGSSVIEAQRYNASGAPVHQDGTTAGLSNFQVSTQSGGTAERPGITVLSNGNFVISWSAEPGNDLTQSDTFFKVYNSSGTLVQGTTEANVTTTGEQSLAQVTALANGGFAMVWTTDPTGSNTDIVARLFNASGVATSAEIAVDTTTTGEQDDANIVALPDGGFLVTWDSNQDTGGSEGIFAQRFDASGNKVGSQFEINGTTSGAQTQHTDADHSPQAVLNNGEVVSVWDGAPGDGGDIFQRLFTVPGDGGENSTGIGLGAITALVTDLVGTTKTNGGHEIIDHLTLSGFPSGTFSVGHAGAGGTWVIDNQSDITAIASSGTQVNFIPAVGFIGNFTLSITATVTDTATLSTGDVTNSLTTSALTIPVGVKAPGDPIFAADSASPFDLHLDPVASGDTVTINSLPGNGHIEYADGTPVAANAVLTAAQFALLKFAPSDLGADTAADFQFTVSDGKTDTLNTVPINLVHGTGVTIDGSVANDHLIGSPGNDVLNGGPGFDFLTGGGGADRFVFDSFALADATSSTPQIDHVTDYSAAQGDTIDLTALFSALSTMHTHISSLVHATEDASGTFTTVQINTASAGQAAHWVNIAQLDGIAVGDTINVNLDPSHPAAAFQIHSETTPAGSHMQALFDAGRAGTPAPHGTDIPTHAYAGPPIHFGADSFGFFHV